MSKRKKDMSVSFKNFLNDTHSKNDLEDILAEVTTDKSDNENQQISLLIRNVFEKNVESKLTKSEVDRIGLNAKSELRKVIKHREELSALNGQNRKLRKSFILRWSVAAAIFICIATGLLIKHNSSVTNNILMDDKTVDKNKIRDKKTEKITLTLANGKSVILNETYGGLVISDDIKYSDGTSLDEIAEIKESDILTLKVPNAMTYKVLLSDKSEVWLNAGSELRYPVKFSGKSRTVQLEGEGFFKVAKNVNNPFTVKTKGQDITVLGTEFNVLEYKKNITTSLLSGAVKIATHKGQIQKLVPGQQSRVNIENGRLDIRNADVNLVSAWREGFFVVEDKTLEQIMNMLSEWYGVDYEIAVSVSKTKRYRGLIPRHSISNTLKRLELLSNLTITVKDNIMKVNN